MKFPDHIHPDDFVHSYRPNPERWRAPFLALWNSYGPDPYLVDQFVPFSDGTNLVAALGPNWIMKVFPPDLRHQWSSEVRVLEHLKGCLKVPIPKLFKAGEDNGWTFIIMNRLQGVTLESIWSDLSDEKKTSILGDIGRIMAEVHSVPVDAVRDLPPLWSSFLPLQVNCCRALHERLGMPRWFVDELDSFISSHLPLLPNSFSPVLLTGEYTPFNLLVRDSSDAVTLEGMIDFGDAMVGFHEYDFLGPLLFSCEGRSEFVQALLTGYGYPKELQNKTLRRRLFLLQILHRYSDFEAQLRIPRWQERVSNLEALENLIWPMS